MMLRKGGCDCCHVKRTDKPAMQDVDMQVGPTYAHCLHFNTCALIGVRESDRGEGPRINCIANAKTALNLEGCGWLVAECVLCVLTPKLAVDSRHKLEGR